VTGLWYPVYPECGQVWNSNTMPFAVEEYARAAREAGPDFVIFLEP